MKTLWQVSDSLQFVATRPSTLPWLGICALIVLLYLLHRRYRKYPVSTLLIWRHVIEPLQRRSLWAFLHRILSLLLWLVAAAAITFSAAGIEARDPYRPVSYTLILDNSASMLAEEGGTSRWDLLQRDVEAFLLRMHPADTASLFVTAPEAALLIPPMSDKTRLRSELHAVKPAFVAGQPSWAVELARSVKDPAQHTLFFCTDGVFAPALQHTTDIRIVPYGNTSNNRGIIRFDISQNPYSRLWSAHWAICNFDTTERETTVQLVDGTNAVLHEEIVHLAPGARLEWTYTLADNFSGIVQARICEPDAFSPDNIAQAFVAGHTLPRVIIVKEDVDKPSVFGPVLEAAKNFFDIEHSRITTPDGWQAMQTDVDAQSIVIFDRCAPKSALLGGCFVFFGSQGEHVPVTTVGALDNPAVTLIDSRHALSRYLSWDGLKINRALAAVAQHGDDIALGSHEHPLIFTGTRGPEETRRFVYIAFDPADTNFHLLDSFPLFFVNILTYFSRDYQMPFAPHYQTGETLESSFQFAQPVTLEFFMPGNSAVAHVADIAPLSDGKLRILGSRPGLYRIQAGESVFPPACVNFIDPRESAIGAIASGSAFPTTVPPAPSWLVGQPIGLWLALAAGYCILLEWLLYHLTKSE